MATRINDVAKIDSLFKIYPNSAFSIYGLARKSYLENGKITDSIPKQFSQREFSKNLERTNLLYQLIEGDIYLDKDNNDSLAFETYQKTLHQAKNINDTLMICESYKKLITILFKNGEQRELFRKYCTAYNGYAYDVNELAFSRYFSLGYKMLSSERDSAQVSFNNNDFESLLLLAENSGNQLLTAYSEQLFGVKFWGYDKNYERALYHYNNAKEIYRLLDYELSRIKLFGVLVNMAAVNIELGKKELALEYLYQAKRIKLPDKNKKDYILYFDKLIRAHVLQGNNDSIFFYLEMKDKAEKYAKTLEQAKTVSELETKYQTTEKEKQILVEKQRSRTIRNWLIAASLTLIFGAGIAILLQKNTSKKRKLAEQEALLEQQKVATLLKDQELTSIDAMIAGQEKERQKVANELHDDLGSLMATVKLHFDNVKVDQKDPALKNAQKLLDKAYQKIRSMAHAKNSGVMANQGLLPAVKKMAKTISETNALKVTVEDFGLGERMENSLELTIFRIIQELMTNIIKHSRATKAHIQFTQHEDKLNIIVADNGKGFDMTAVQRSTSGMGLGTIEKRIEHLEGSFTVDSVLGNGTSILIDIPV